MKKKVALIFGITGQDGSYLANFLIKKGYLVHGVKEDLLHLTQAGLTTFTGSHEKKEYFLHHGDIMTRYLFHQ